MKLAKGITLVALVITIIVLLILAGVSISFITGNNGVVTQAKDTSKNASVARAKQDVEDALVDANVEFLNYWVNYKQQNFVESLDSPEFMSKINLTDYNFQERKAKDESDNDDLLIGFYYSLNGWYYQRFFSIDVNGERYWLAVGTDSLASSDYQVLWYKVPTSTSTIYVDELPRENWE